MLRIGRVNELVVIQITDAGGAVVAQTALSVEAANLATRRIMDTVKEIKAAAKTAEALTQRVAEAAKPRATVPPSNTTKPKKK